MTIIQFNSNVVEVMIIHVMSENLAYNAWKEKIEILIKGEQFLLRNETFKLALKLWFD